MTSPDTFSRTQIILHWLVAALVLFQIFFHEGIEDLWQDRMRGTIENIATPQPHTIVGMLIGLLIIWRLILRLRRGTPPAPAQEPKILQLASKIAHWGFYVLLILMASSGAAAWFGGATPPAAAHGIMANALIALVVVHMLGALTHQFYFKSNVLRRMLGMS